MRCLVSLTKMDSSDSFRKGSYQTMSKQARLSDLPESCDTIIFGVQTYMVEKLVQFKAFRYATSHDVFAAGTKWKDKIVALDAMCSMTIFSIACSIPKRPLPPLHWLDRSKPYWLASIVSERRRRVSSDASVTRKPGGSQEGVLKTCTDSLHVPPGSPDEFVPCVRSAHSPGRVVRTLGVQPR
jgi:hypothetical protein